MNILILGLSTFSTQKRDIDGVTRDVLTRSKMSTDSAIGISLEQEYVYQLEPVPIMLYNKLGKKIDLVIEIGTAQTEKKKEVYLETGTMINASPREFFEDRLKNQVVEFRSFLIDGEDDVMPQQIMEIVRLLRTIKEKTEYDLWIDNHGGLRNSQMVLQCILSLLKKDNIQPKETYMLEYTNGVGVVRVAKQANSINEFVSGVNEFLNFGRSQSIQKYFELNDEENELPKKIKDIADSIQLCNVEAFETALDAMQEWIINNNQSYQRKYQELFVEYLQSDYGDLLSKEKRTTLKEIAWCIEKDFIQQALTLIESKMPREIMRYGHVSYGDNWEKGKCKLTLSEVINKNKNWWEPADNYMLQQFCYTNVLDYYYDWRGKQKHKHLKLENLRDKRGIRVNTEERQPIELTYNKKNKETVLVDVKLPSEQIQLETLYKLLKLHMSLKNQRNMINHAKEGDHSRASVQTLKNAINIYMELSKDLGIV